MPPPSGLCDKCSFAIMIVPDGIYDKWSISVSGLCDICSFAITNVPDGRCDEWSFAITTVIRGLCDKRSFAVTIVPDVANGTLLPQMYLTVHVT
jgi:hypothetical protein